MHTVWQLSQNKHFPPVDDALDELDGLLAVGGDLSTERLLNAYKQGIFPWFSEGQQIRWYSPNPRMVITQQTLKISKSLQKILNQKRFDVKVNQKFAAVIAHCANAKRKQNTGTWITNSMQTAYIALHKLNFAHSVEVYQDNILVGGLYGVALGRVFFGESMFSNTSNASKVALVYLLSSLPYKLIDCQVANPHLKSLGAYNMDRKTFMSQIQALI